MKRKIVIITFLLLSVVSFAQQKRVKTTIDTTKVKFGYQINLTLKTTTDTLSKVIFPKGNYFGRLEVLETYPTDTVKEGFNYHLTKKYGLTQWDSGKYTIPRLNILINNKPFLSDSIQVEFLNVAVDTVKQPMHDIKNVIQAPKESSSWWIYLLILLGVLALIAFGYYLYKKFKKIKKEEIVFATPIEKANAHLKNLELKNLIQKGEIKAYYSELTDIARTFIEEAIKIPALESTTSELVDALKNSTLNKKLSLSKETLDNLEAVLKQADLVKFAKSKPQEFEIESDRKKIASCITKINQSIPEEIDDLKLNQELLLKKYQQRKRKQKIATAGMIVSFILFGVFIFFVVTKGITFVKDTIIGHPTKELAEGEWVTSEYGIPPIKVETPKVLKRMDVSNLLPKDTLSPLLDMQMFSYGGIMDNFYVFVSSAQYKENTEIDFNKVLEGNIVTWEKAGAQNILLKQEKFDTKKGVTGLRAYGTMMVLNNIKKESIKMYYEILLFKQDNGLQQVHLSIKENDKYGEEIIDRIINSVELGKLK